MLETYASLFTYVCDFVYLSFLSKMYFSAQRKGECIGLCVCVCGGEAKKKVWGEGGGGVRDGAKKR